MAVNSDVNCFSPMSLDNTMMKNFVVKTKDESSDSEGDSASKTVSITYNCGATVINNVSENIIHSLLRNFPSTKGTCFAFVKHAQNLKYYRRQSGSLRDYLPHISQEELHNVFLKYITKALMVNSVDLSLTMMYSKYQKIQMPHVDYDWKSLKKHGNDLFVGFFPLSIDGMQIIYWPDPVDNKNLTKSKGKMVFIKYRQLYLLPAKFPHAGGFCSGLNGNPRAHLYIAVRSAKLPNADKNEYRFPKNGALLPEKFVFE